ncbi:hypothetical protein LBMAG56_10920 [Verrucomicrobiota bacterium]|nr:hypothetical protein LBMAG56_10920 [Verrucomicrobiota bacterium]
MRIAFKEWAVVVDALGRGDQIVILRKGGISEGAGGFQVEHPQFLLFPTLYHQQREHVAAAAQARYDVIAPDLPGPETLRLDFFGVVVAWRRLDSLAAAERLRGQHIWRDAVIAERFEWGRNRNIFALAVRIHRLPQRLEWPMRPEFGGCKSWVELTPGVDVTGALPVLDDAAFTVKLAAFHAALELETTAAAALKP